MGKIHNRASSMSCTYLTFEFDSGFERTQVGDGKAFLVVVVGELLLFLGFIDGRGKMWEMLFDCHCPEFSAM